MKNCFLTCFYCLLMGLILFSCKPTEREQLVEQKIKMINSNMEEWNELTEKILKTEFTEKNYGSPHPYIDQLDSTLQKELEQKGIIHITSIYTNGKCSYIQYMTNWSKYPVGDFFINYHSCAKEMSREGYYKRDRFIEVWGIGKGWSITVDSDWI